MLDNFDRDLNQYLAEIDAYETQWLEERDQQNEVYKNILPDFLSRYRFFNLEKMQENEDCELHLFEETNIDVLEKLILDRRNFNNFVFFEEQEIIEDLRDEGYLILKK